VTCGSTVGLFLEVSPRETS